MSENKNLRKCSRCHATKLEEYFSTNTKGELYKLCDNCRSKQQTYYKEWNENNKEKLKECKEKSRAKFKEKPFEEQYSKCEKCGRKFHKVYEGKSRHQKRWPCVKSQMEGSPGKKEFFEWILENRDNILRDYQKYISQAEEYCSPKVSK